MLIIEDEADTAEMFAEMMRANGHRPVKVIGSGSALSRISEERPDVILLDMMMPDRSGLDLLREIRGGAPGLCSIPVIVISAKTLPADIRAGLEAGASRYLTKPVGFRELAEAVERAIRAA